MRNLTRVSGLRFWFGRKQVMVLVVIVFIFMIFIWRWRANEGVNSEGSVGVSGDSAQSENMVLDSIELENSYNFIALNDQGVLSTEVVFRITKAEKTKEVLVQGKPANAKGSKAFLVLQIEIDNGEVERRYLSPVEMLRLIGENDKKFAPDIHSDIVEIQPISTKITRVGFVIEENQSNFVIQVGALEGDKEIVNVNFN